MPDFRAQFSSKPQPYVYMGGTAMSCGQHPSLPKRHRWGPWRKIMVKATGAIGWGRTCKTCALVSDMRWTKPATFRDTTITEFATRHSEDK